MFYLIEITEGDPKVEGKGIYAYETKVQAIASFHSKMGAAMKSDLYSRELLIVTDENGTVVKRELFVKPAPVVAPEAEAPAIDEPEIGDETGTSE